MSEPTDPAIPFAASIVSLLFMLIASGICIFYWATTHAAAYLVGAVAFLVLAPLWHRSPMSAKGLFSPIGTGLIYKRRFTRLDMVLTVVGYPMILVAIGLRLFA